MANQFDNQWPAEKANDLEKIVRSSLTSKEAASRASKLLNRNVSEEALKTYLRRKGTPISTLLKKNQYLPQPEADNDFTYARLVDAVRKPISFSQLCDKLDLSPTKTRALCERAKQDGIKIRLESDHVGLDMRDSDDRVTESDIAPTVGKRQEVAVISDTHLGSKYCLRKPMIEFINYAYDRGIRDILHCGDALDGDYRHAKFEMSHMGLEDQTRDLFETLPKRKGLRYHAITGNHDFTFTAQAGVDVGRYIEGYFREHGRDDIRFYGQRSVYLKIRGVVIHMWHPRSGRSYARSYHLQKRIEGYSAIKPQVLLAGHWHFFGYIFERGVHAMGCPTFQGEGSDFSNSLPESPSIGGLILGWDLTKDGTIRHFVPEYRCYYQREKPVDVDNYVDGNEVEFPARVSKWAK